MSKIMLYGALMIHLAVGIFAGLTVASIVGDTGGIILWILMFLCGVVLYLTVVGAIGLFLTYVIGIGEEDNEQYDER